MKINRFYVYLNYMLIKKYGCSNLLGHKNTLIKKLNENLQ